MKLLLLSCYNINNWDTMALTLRNRLDYCKKWDIDNVYMNVSYTASCMSKLMKPYRGYDYVITIGEGVLFENFQKDLKEILSQKFLTVGCEKSTVNGNFIVWKPSGLMLEKFSLWEKECGGVEKALLKGIDDKFWREHMDVIPYGEFCLGKLELPVV